MLGIHHNAFQIAHIYCLSLLSYAKNCSIANSLQDGLASSHLTLRFLESGISHMKDEDGN
jgi:hypothetical protein